MKDIVTGVLETAGYSDARASKMDIDDFLMCVPPFDLLLCRRDGHVQQHLGVSRFLRHARRLLDKFNQANIHFA